MATTETVGKELAKAEPVKDLRKLIEASAKELGRALPEHMRPERLVRIALTCIRQNPKLTLCTPESFLGALFTAAQIGIEPIAKRAYILPFNNRRKMVDPKTGVEEWKTVREAQFLLGYPGVAELFYRHEKAVQLAWGDRRQNDNFSQELGTNAFLRHVPADGDRGPVLGYYVIANLTNGGKPFLYMTRDACLEHGRKHSKTYDKKTSQFYDDSPWRMSEDSMCLKTVFLQLSKLLPLSMELRRALQADETSREYRIGVDDALDIQSTTVWEDAPLAALDDMEPKK